MKSIPFLALFCLTFSVACGPTIQTTSGAAYVAARAGTIDADIAQVAAIEPDLRFPARIGIARVVNGRLSSPTGGEAALFGDFVSRNAAYGTFVPVSPLVASMVGASADNAAATQTIRRAAARQHLDYVLIYEVGTRSTTGNTPFALADVTLIGGMLLPTRHIKMAGIGQAALVDVRNGYPYGTTAVVEDLSGFSRTFNSHRRSAELRDKAILAVVQELIPDVEEMLKMLKARSGQS